MLNHNHRIHNCDERLCAKLDYSPTNTGLESQQPNNALTRGTKHAEAEPSLPSGEVADEGSQRPCGCGHETAPELRKDNGDQYICVMVYAMAVVDWLCADDE